MLKRILGLAVVVALAAAAAPFFAPEPTSLPDASLGPEKTQVEPDALAGGVSSRQGGRWMDAGDPKTLGGSKTGAGDRGVRPSWSGHSILEAEHGYGFGGGLGRPASFEADKVQTGSAGQPIPGEPERSSEDKTPELPLAGRVSSEWGEGIPGIGVIASAQHLFSREQEVNPSSVGIEKRSWTDGAGYYEFQRLPAGEYEIRTESTVRFPSARIRVRAGTESADLVLQESRALRVYGTVRDSAGDPLTGALVQPVGQDDTGLTDARGDYALTLTVGHQGQSYTLDVSMPEYRDRRLGIREAEVRGLDEIRVDAELEPLAETAVVSGIVTDMDGVGVDGASVRLYSSGSKQSFHARTEPNGDFVLPDVEVAEGYQFWVQAGERFIDHLQEPVEIPREGLDLAVVLESAGTASLSGRMVDALGNPIPWLGLWLRSSDSAATLGMVSGDGNGYFQLEDLQAGELSLQTHISPYLRVTGIRLAAGENESVELTLDWGDLVIQGQVTDEQGHPVPGAEISVSWSLQDGQLHSRSSRRTTSAADGTSTVSGLGPGIHALSVDAPGFEAAWMEHDALTDSRELLVELASEDL